MAKYYLKVPIDGGALVVRFGRMLIFYICQTGWGVIVSVQDILALGDQNSVAGVGNSGDSSYFPRNTSDRSLYL